MTASPPEHPVDHVAIAVRSIEESRSLFELLTGQPGSPVETLESQGVRVAFFGMFELLEPLGPDTHVARFIERRGEALHHVALRVPDLTGELARLEQAGVKLIDKEPRPGARGHRIAFLHPSSTLGVLTELVEADQVEG